MRKILLKVISGLWVILAISCTDDRAMEDPFSGERAARLGVGRLANQLLAGDRFTRLEIELVYMTGYRPTNFMLENMVTFLQNHVNKPDGIIFRQKEIPALAQNKYTIADIRELEQTHRERYNERGIFTMFLLIVDGYFSQDDKESFALGAAYNSSSTVLFGPRIVENSGGFRRPSLPVLEATVTIHEIGHLMGLVNNGTDMVHEHEDDNYESHCDNERCLMYWAVETNRGLNLLGTTIPELDENCRKDIRANGGK
jgi:predicted Zn-dependent protease